MNQLKPYEFEQYLNSKNFSHFRFQSADQPSASCTAPIFDLHFNRIEVFHNPDRIRLSQGFNSVSFPLLRCVEIDESSSVRGTILLLSCLQDENELQVNRFLILADK